MQNESASHARIAIFDLDHTLLPIDSDYEWGQFLCKIGAVDRGYFELCNKEYFAQYQAGTLNATEYLEFALNTLTPFSAKQLADMHAQFMREVIRPAITPAANQLLALHKNDLLLMITATNRFVTGPIAKAFGFEHLIAAQPEFSPEGLITGKLVGTPTSGTGKVDHLMKWLQQQDKTLSSFERSYFYSDSHNDIPLLDIVSHPIATNPDEKLTAYAQRHGWPILKLFK
ncbi:HAD superfamily hydrolase (TIGR01490 family) [Oxalobacteraceae bacterium GrIS 2.11]